MNFSLSPHLEELVRQKVERGQYESFRQVVEEALLLLEERDQIRAMRRDRLLQEIATGLYQADNRQLVDQGEVFRALRRKPSSANE
jgi:antitoxin ParD1/3/4